MSTFNATAYGPVFAPLLASDRRRPLDSGRANVAARPALELLTIESAFAHVPRRGERSPVVDGEMAACCLAGVWLLHDFLDESHTISQQIDTTSGSFWHGIMHRREGDFSNAKYWFRRVGRHPVFELLAEQVHLGESRHDAQSRFGETRPRAWDPFAFIDECQDAVRGNSSARDRCLTLQQGEWELLFDHCYGHALGELARASS